MEPVMKMLELEKMDLPLFAMGFTARDQEQMKKNLKALEAAGIKYPDSFPQVYPCQRYILTEKDYIEVVVDSTCGEVEYLIVILSGKVYIGVGSDHADKVMEQDSIINSKQICAKHYAKHFWDYEELKDHWDEIKVRSYQERDGKWELYQDGDLSKILTVETTLEFMKSKYGELKDCVIFGGSIASLNGIYYGDAFRYSMEDPVLNRKIGSEYRVINIAKKEEI